MTVYHMGTDGTPKVCKARKTTCPLGGEHFNSLKDAKNYAEIKAAEEFHTKEEKTFEEIFTVAQRRRMFEQNPVMSYVHPLGTVLISKRGDLWDLVKREQTGGQLDHKFTLKNRRSGKTVIVSTSYSREPQEKSTADFAQLLPHYFQVDGPPLRAQAQLKELPQGTTKLKDTLIAKIRVYTVENELDKELPPVYNEYGEEDREAERKLYGRNLNQPKYRYLVVPNTKREELDEPAKRDEISLALWSQAGRDMESWSSLTPQEKTNLLLTSKDVKKATFFNKNGSTTFTNEDLRSDQFDSFWLPGGTPSSGVSLYEPKIG